MAPDGLFKVKILTSKIDEKILAANSSQHKTLRNNLVPKKIEIFVWRALRKRLPVRIELDKIGIDLHSVRCPLCDEDVESVDHSLISCKLAIEVWDRVFRWWKMGTFGSYTLVDVLNDKGSQSMTSLGKKICQAIKWVCAYLVWSNRNNKVFKDKCWNAPVALNEIQAKYFEWISNRVKRKKVEWHVWLSNPRVYLNL
ncbi:uncharacterized protein [Rutidosis leptorrhynchoides]|uniref:uncharacterized protein n=1 Tax=Rutidosis leptorrhynchoides TaxID=125765 RepID=UPI003A9A250E